MSIFAVVLTKIHPNFVKRLKEAHPKAYQLNDMSFLITGDQGSLEIATALGLREETRNEEEDVRGVVIRLYDYAGYTDKDLINWTQSSGEGK